MQCWTKTSGCFDKCLGLDEGAYAVQDQRFSELGEAAVFK